jgi:hypothetical protein
LAAKNSKSSRAVGAAPSAATMQTLMSSSPNGDGTATAAARRTAGWVMTVSSSSNEETFSPRRRSESLVRSTKVRKPWWSATAASPVWCQRLRQEDRVASGLRQYPEYMA